MRVAVTQFATTENPQDNLTCCINSINEAASCQPNLIVLPQYANTNFYNAVTDIQQNIYRDHNHAWQDAVTIDGDFLAEISKLAQKHNSYIVINVTLRQDSCRDNTDDSIKSNISVATCLFSSQGQLVHLQHKSSLSLLESQYFTENNDGLLRRGLLLCESAVVNTPLAKIGFLSGNDTMGYQTSHKLAAAGAQLMCNLMDTGTKDQTEFHDPARANQNNVFIISANKTNQNAACVNHSQIISPEGRVIAKVNTDKEAFTFADIDLELASYVKKQRTDGTVVNDHRRSDLYQSSLDQSSLNQGHLANIKPSAVNLNANIPSTANVALFATYKSNEEAIEDVCHYIENNLSDIIQLPELFFVADKTVTSKREERDDIALLSQLVIKKVSAALRPHQYLCTSLLIEGNHQAVIINDKGLFATQQQLHFCNRYQWTELAEKLNVVALPLEQGSINLAMLTADDAHYPEMIAALQGAVQLFLVPFDIQHPCEAKFSLISAAIENNICLVAATREKSLKDSLTLANTTDSPFAKNKEKIHKSTGLIVNLAIKADLLPKWQIRKPSGYKNEPVIKHQFGKITKAVIHPLAACTKN